MEFSHSRTECRSPVYGLHVRFGLSYVSEIPALNYILPFIRAARQATAADLRENHRAI